MGLVQVAARDGIATPTPGDRVAAADGDPTGVYRGDEGFDRSGDREAS